MVRDKEDGKRYSPDSPKEWLETLLSLIDDERDSFIMETIGNADQNKKANILLYCAAENPEVFLTLSKYLRGNHIVDGMINNKEAAFIRLKIDPNMSDAEEKLQESLNKEFADYLSEIKDKDGKSPIILAAEKGNTEIVQYLIEIGCNVNQEDSNKMTAIKYAAQNGHTEIVEYLLKKHVIISSILDKIGHTSIILAAKAGHLDIVKLLLPKEIKIWAEHPFGSRLSSLATDKENDSNTAKLIVQQENQLYEEGKIPCASILVSAKVKKKNSFSELINYENELFARNEIKYTSLMIAAERNDPAIGDAIKMEKELLLARGWLDNSSLILAVRGGLLDIVKCLVEKGADVNQKNIYGYTALMEAALHNKPEIMKYLIENGANVNQTFLLVDRFIESNGEPETVLDMALSSYKRQHSPEAKKCIEILIKAGATLDTEDLKKYREDKNLGYLINKYELEKSNREMKALRMIKEEKNIFENVNDTKLIALKDKILDEINNKVPDLSALQKMLGDKRADKSFVLSDLGLDISGLNDIQLEKLAKSAAKIIKKGFEEKIDHNIIKEKLAKQLVIKTEMMKIRSQNENKSEQTKSWVGKITSVFSTLRSGKSK